MDAVCLGSECVRGPGRVEPRSTWWEWPWVPPAPPAEYGVREQEGRGLHKETRKELRTRWKV